MKHIKGLDTLRALGMFLVIMQHFGFWFDTTSPSGRFISIVLIPDGGFALDLFFVLSGFLITSILLKAKTTTASRNVVIKNFFVRRALRIFPIYYLLLLLLLLINYPDVRQNIAYFATYTSNILSYRTNSWNAFSHSWSLSVEEQFYLLWPWLIIFVPNKYLKYIFTAAFITGVISTFVTMGIQKHIAPFLVWNCIDSFSIGAAYALVRLNSNDSKRFEKAVKIIVNPTLIFYFYIKTGLLNNWVIPGPAVMKTVNSIIAVWIIMLVVQNRSARMEKYLWGNRLLNYLGKISYGTYLYHYVYINFFFKFVNKFLYDITLPYPAVNNVIHDHHADYWIEVSIMVLVAAISYEAIEKPILQLKKYYRYSSKAAKTA